MFSNRGEEQFAPHETMAVEHFAEIFFASGGYICMDLFSESG
jgi:hypothetical protein